MKKSTIVEKVQKKESPITKNPFIARPESPTVREDEVTDILDDNDIISPLMRSISKD